MFIRSIDSLALMQDGLVTAKQATEILGRERMRRWVKSERLVRVLHGVYRLAGVPSSPTMISRAALLAAPAGAMLSFTTAAYLHGLMAFDEAQATSNRSGATTGSPSGFRGEKL